MILIKVDNGKYEVQFAMRPPFSDLEDLGDALEKLITDLRENGVPGAMVRAYQEKLIDSIREV